MPIADIASVSLSERKEAESAGVAIEVVAVAFQIVALTLDADDNVIERRVVPRPYPTREEAVTAIGWLPAGAEVLVGNSSRW